MKLPPNLASHSYQSHFLFTQNQHFRDDLWHLLGSSRVKSSLLRWRLTTFVYLLCFCCFFLFFLGELHCSAGPGAACLAFHEGRNWWHWQSNKKPLSYKNFLKCDLPGNSDIFNFGIKESPSWLALEFLFCHGLSRNIFKSIFIAYMHEGIGKHFPLWHTICIPVFILCFSLFSAFFVTS